MITLVGNESDMSLLTFPNSGNTYYFRSFIPVDLIEHFGGIKEFRIDLEDAIRNNNGDDLECFHDNKIALRQMEVMGWGDFDYKMSSKIFLVYTKKPYKLCKEFAPLKDVSSDDF